MTTVGYLKKARIYSQVSKAEKDVGELVYMKQNKKVFWINTTQKISYRKRHRPHALSGYELSKAVCIVESDG